MTKVSVPDWFLPMILGVVISLQGWSLIEIVNLKVAVAVISKQLNPEIVIK